MKKKLTKNIIFLITLLAIGGLLAGIFGGIVAYNYFVSDFSLPYAKQEVNLTNLNNANSNFIIQEPKKVVINQDQKIAETINSLSTSIVGVFKEIDLEEEEAKAVSAKPAYYSLNDPLFIGLIMTSDGWVMSSLSAEDKKTFTSKDFVAISADRKIYQIDKVNVVKDLPGDIVFFHLAEAENLPVRKIASRSELSLGQSLLVINSRHNAWPTTLASFEKTPDILNSDSVNARLSLSNNSDALQQNSLVFNLSGDLVAIISADKEVVPAFAHNYYWQSFWGVVKNVRPSFGVNYLDLASTKILEKNLDKGALIYPRGKVAVLENSPAQKAGLQEGDIITWINNRELDKQNDLADVIATYKSGDKITVSYWRDGQEKQVDLILGEFKVKE
ncbi:serine protease [Candidatus Falkowbacteria bacterium]|jgi:hypothetical protein|nr:serine protease [Candidatus Falkowbacteria bacterium]